MKITTFLLLLFLCFSAEGEPRTWNLKNGTTLEGEFLNFSAKTVMILDRSGKKHRVSYNALSQDDALYVQLQSPPRLAIDVAKLKESRPYIATPWTIQSGTPAPIRLFYTYKVKVTQETSNPYDLELKIDLFIIGDEVHGHNHFLVDHLESAPFTLTDRIFTYAPENEYPFVKYNVSSQYLGKEYNGTYLVLITDTRGEIIAHKTNRKYLFENLENLRKLPIGAYFDKTCTKCRPTSPKAWGY